MAEAAIKCPHCQSEVVVKYGKASNGKERFRCQQRSACGRTFVRSYAYPGCLPTVKQQIVDMTLTGSSLACPQLPPDHLRPGSLAPNIGDHGPSDSALAAARAWRLRRPGADRHAARCASREIA